MPNWCEGNIRFRGNMSDILKCLSEILEFCIYDYKANDNLTKPAVVKLEDEYVISVKSPWEDPKRSWCHIKGTHRNFIHLMNSEFESATIVRTKYDSVRPGDVVVFDDFKAAWNIDVEPYLEIAKKYNVDIAVYAWEQGVGFSRRIVIEDGNIVTNYTYDPPAYEIYAWITEMPYLGG